MKVRDLYLKGKHIIVTNSGDKSRFCYENWNNMGALCTAEPNLFEICDNKNILVKEAREINWQLYFRRSLDGESRP
jgi:hypothetical protein